MEKEFIDYYVQNQTFKGYAAYRPIRKSKRPAILVCHAWFGQDDFARQKAEELADLGCVGFAVDLYGEGKTVQTSEDALALMTPLMENRVLIRQRLQAALETVKKIPAVDSNHIGVIGFCFGGACALELARSGASIKGAVSFHGLLQRDKTVKNESIQAAILALHGYEDPLVSQTDLYEFQEEMNQANVDWQLITYGKTMHAFTNPMAQSPSEGKQFNKESATRSWKAMKGFFKQQFSDEPPLPMPPLMA